MVGKGSTGAAFWLALCVAIGCGGSEPETVGRTEAMQAPAGVSHGDEGGLNAAPVIESVRLEPHRPERGRPVRAIVEVHDDDGDPVRLSYLWTLDGERVPGDAQVALPRSRKGDLVEVRVTANDGTEDSRSVEASVRVANQPPRLRGLQIQPANHINAGTEISVRASADDPDGDSISYRYTWRVNDTVTDDEGPVLETRQLRRGDKVRVTAVASDGEDESEPISSAEIEVANAPPRIVSRPGGAGPDGSFRYQVEAEDLDDQRSLRFSLAEAPEGMTIGALSGRVEWRPKAQQTGSHPVEIVVEDMQGGRDSQRFELTVGVEEQAKPPAPASPAPAADEPEPTDAE